jgi:GNAT superfamily N-acetyltransferase
MKEILREWKKFLLKENSQLVPYTDERLEKKISLYMYQEGNENYGLILYRKEKYVDGFYVIGYASIDLLSDDGDERFSCIPQTYQVAAIYVEPELQGQGFGKILYSLAFAVIPDGAGLTSDKYSGTLAGAQKGWKKMEKSSEYDKRKTPMGNDEFDYDTKKTPNDKMDDCKTDMNLGDSNATDHSLEKKNNSLGKQLFNDYAKQHFENDFMNRDDVESRLLNTAMKRFGKIYTQAAI